VYKRQLAADPSGAPVSLQALAAFAFVLACVASCFAVLAVAIRFAAQGRSMLDGLKHNAYGMYLVHYFFVVWLQYALLGSSLPAIVKGVTVFAGTLALSWASVEALRRVPSAAQIIGAGRATGGTAR